MYFVIILILRFVRGVFFVSQNISGIKQNYFSSYDKLKVGNLVRIADFVLNLEKLRSGSLLSVAHYPHLSLQSYCFFLVFARGNPYLFVGESLFKIGKPLFLVGKSLRARIACAPVKCLVIALAGWEKNNHGVGFFLPGSTHSRGPRPAGRACKPKAASCGSAHGMRAGRPA